LLKNGTAASRLTVANAAVWLSMVAACNGKNIHAETAVACQSLSHIFGVRLSWKAF